MITLGNTDIKFNKEGIGCMGMSEFYKTDVSDESGIALLRTAYANGVNFWDTADVYGFGDNEILIGKAISEMIADNTMIRDDITIASKYGILRSRDDVTKRGVDNSYDYTKKACEASLMRLGLAVGHIDLFYVHRIANDGEQLDEAMCAMAELLHEGKIKAVGLSEATPKEIRIAQTALLKYTKGKHQISAVQTEYSLLSRGVENNHVLATCRELGITFVAYSPLCRALLTGKIDSEENLEDDDFRKSLPRFQGKNLEFNATIVARVKAIAESKGCSTPQVALAWLMHQENVAIIPGTTKEKNLLDNVGAMHIKLTVDELAALNGLDMARGYRYTEDAMKAYGLGAEMEAADQAALIRNPEKEKS